MLQQLQTNLTNIINPSTAQTEEQRVRLIKQERQQRVIDDTPIITIPQITNAQPIMQSRNPTAKRNLKQTPRTHRRHTRNNTPGAVPPITRIVDDNPHGFPPYNPPNVVYEHDPTDPILAFLMIKPILASIQCKAQNNIVSNQAINALVMLEQCTPSKIFTPRSLESSRTFQPIHDLKHFANPMVHPVTGEIISSYRKAMQDPAIAEVWQTAFGKELGRLAQENKKLKRKAPMQYLS